MMNAPLDSVGRDVIVNKINLDDEADALRAVTNYGGVDTGAKH